MRDIFLAIVVIGALPFCIYRPWIGILVWSWLAYMNPHRLAWGFAFDQPWAQMVAVATILGLFVSKEWRPLPMTRELYLLFAFWVMIIVSTIFSEYPDGRYGAWAKLEQVSKILLFTVITIGVMQDRNKF